MSSGVNTAFTHFVSFYLSIRNGSLSMKGGGKWIRKKQVVF